MGTGSDLPHVSVFSLGNAPGATALVDANKFGGLDTWDSRGSNPQISYKLR